MSRLPIPGGDDGSWGGILNDFLGKEHNADGTQKTLPITKGGTGAIDAATARSSLGAVANTDSRLSDARTPLAHKNTHATGGTDALAPVDIGAVDGSDSRLSDQRTPLDGSVTDAKITAGGLSPGKVAGTAVITTDSRLEVVPTAVDLWWRSWCDLLRRR
jgi:hypothetical protein